MKKESIVTKGELVAVSKGSMNEYIQWVLRARSTDPIRHPLRHLRVETEKGEKKFVATDGKRVHVYTTDTTFAWEIADGNYAVVRSSKSETVLKPVDGIDYPNWRQVITTGARSVGYASDENRACFLIMKNGIGVTLKYIIDATCPFMSETEVMITDEHSPVMLETDNLLAVIMPRSMK